MATRRKSEIRNPKSEIKGMEPVITESMGIKEVLDRYPHLFGVFEDHGLHFCAGCYVMLASNIEQGANYSGLRPADREELLAELNRLARDGGQAEARG